MLHSYDQRRFLHLEESFVFKGEIYVFGCLIQHILPVFINLFVNDRGKKPFLHTGGCECINLDLPDFKI